MTHGDWAPPRDRRRGDRQDPGGDAPDRLADRHEARPAQRDPGPHVHRQGCRGDAGPGGPAGAVRLHGHGHLDLPRLRRPCHPRACPGAGPAVGAARPVASGDGDLPSGAALPAGSRRVPASRQSDPLPRCPRHALLAPQGRGRLAGSLRRPCRAPCPRGRGADPRPARAGRAPGDRPPAGRAGRRLRALPGAPWRGGSDRLRRPGRPRVALDAGASGGPGGAAGALPLHPGRRVPGREPGPGGARRAARRAAPERRRGGRRRPVDLPLPRRCNRRHRRLPGALPRGADDRAAPQLPLARADPRCVAPADPVQRPRSAGGPAGDLEAAHCPASHGLDRQGRRSPGGRDAGPAPRLRDRVRGGRLDRDGDCHPRRGRHGAARLRGPGAGQRRCRPGPAKLQPGRRAVALLGSVGVVRSPGDPRPAGIPARSRGPRQLGRRLRAGRLRRVRPGRRRPLGAGEPGTPDESLPVGDARRGGRPAGPPPPSSRHPDVAGAARRRPASLQRAGPPAPGWRSPIRLPADIGFTGAADAGGHRRAPTRPSRTSPASSRSSGPNRTCWPTTARSSWRPTCRR